MYIAFRSRKTPPSGGEFVMGGIFRLPMLLHKAQYINSIYCFYMKKTTYNMALFDFLQLYYIFEFSFLFLIHISMLTGLFAHGQFTHEENICIKKNLN